MTGEEFNEMVSKIKDLTNEEFRELVSREEPPHYYNPFNNTTYVREGDFYFPAMKLPEQPEETVGMWGERRYQYLKEHNEPQLMMYVTSVTLKQHLLDVDREAKVMYDQLKEKMYKEAGLTAELKMQDMMKWVGIAENVEHSIREIIYNELIYV